MSVLRTIESKLESLFEGIFGRAFRTNVQPVELARKLVKEMEHHRTVSVSRVYVPNEYTVYLSTPDREQFTGYETSLTAELRDYLTEHARREGYVLLTPPAVLIETDDDFAQTVDSVRDHDLFKDISRQLDAYIQPYDPDTWKSPKDAQAREFYSWEPEE